MTEAEWLASDDPQAMLYVTSGPEPEYGGFATSKLSARKLRLFACACCYRVGKHLSPDVYHAIARVAVVADGLDLPHDLDVARQCSCDATADICVRAAASNDPLWAAEDAAHRARPFDSATAQAALLRCIAGNPFRPVVLPSFRSYRCPAGCVFGSTSRDDERIPEFCRPNCGKRVIVERRPLPCPWLTPTVLTLALGAYQERGRKCDRCKGVQGRWGRGEYDAVWKDCSTCGGTGTIDDGTLDPARLLVLSDALEEAGYADPRTRADVMAERKNAVMGGCCNRFANNQRCDCLESATDHGILRHLRSPGPHYRGCWAADLILGKE